MDESRKVWLWSVAAVCMLMAAQLAVWGLIEEGYTTWYLFVAVACTFSGVHSSILAWRAKRANDAGGTASDVEQ